jgi:hypothetical protein
VVEVVIKEVIFHPLFNQVSLAVQEEEEKVEFLKWEHLLLKEVERQVQLTLVVEAVVEVLEILQVQVHQVVLVDQEQS